MNNRLQMVLTILCGVMPMLWAESAPRMAGRAPSRKIILLNSGVVPLSSLRKNVREYEDKAPFSGIVLHLNGQGERDGKKVVASAAYGVFNPEPWQREWFQKDVNDLKNTDFQRFTDNFVIVSCRGRNLGWFEDSDQAWDVVSQKFAMVAGMARETGCVGICLDPEFYSGQTDFSFTYDPACGRSFDAAWDMAAARGRQVAAAIGKEFPDIKLFMLFGFSLGDNLLQNSDPYPAMATHRYGLWFAFLNGMYSAMTPQMVFIDGNETAGYTARHEQDYIAGIAQCFRCTRALLTHDNRARMPQSQVAASIYLDAYFLDRRIPNYDVAPDLALEDKPARIKLFTRNLLAACRWASEYVWVYGEQGRWWRQELVPWIWGKEKVRLWDDFAPGLTETIRLVCYPNDSAQRYDGQPNLAHNTSFDFIKNYDQFEPPADRSYYLCEIDQWRVSRTTATQPAAKLSVLPKAGWKGANAVAISGYDYGMGFSQLIAVSGPGRYLVTMRYYAPKVAGNSRINFSQKLLGKWQAITTFSQDIPLPPDADGRVWHSVSALYEAIDGVDYFTYGISVPHQKAPDDVFLVSSPAVKRIE